MTSDAHAQAPHPVTERRKRLQQMFLRLAVVVPSVYYTLNLPNFFTMPCATGPLSAFAPTMLKTLQPIIMTSICALTLGTLVAGLRPLSQAHKRVFNPVWVTLCLLSAGLTLLLSASQSQLLQPYIYLNVLLLLSLTCRRWATYGILAGLYILAGLWKFNPHYLGVMDFLADPLKGELRNMVLVAISAGPLIELTAGMTMLTRWRSVGSLVLAVMHLTIIVLLYLTNYGYGVWVWNAQMAALLVTVAVSTLQNAPAAEPPTEQAQTPTQDRRDILRAKILSTAQRLKNGFRGSPVAPQARIVTAVMVALSLLAAAKVLPYGMKIELYSGRVFLETAVIEGKRQNIVKYVNDHYHFIPNLSSLDTLGRCLSKRTDPALHPHQKSSHTP